MGVTSNLTIWGKLKRFRGTKYYKLNVGCIITRLGIVYDQSGCGCVYMDASYSEYAVASDGCYIALLKTGSFSWLLPTVGARSLRCFAIRSTGIRRRQPRHRDTIPNYIPSQRREGPSRHRGIGTHHNVTIICRTTWRMIFLNSSGATH